jgi:transketolase
MSETNLRTAYGKTLVELARENKNIVALEADLGKSTMSCLLEAEFPERHFEMGIAEANMASTAAGFALSGKIPFIHSFAVFASGRAYDQLRQTIGIGGLKVRVCGSSAGLSDFSDGSTHQSVEDIALMRAIPGMTVLCPADANETVNAVKAMVDIDGPAYIRVCRNPIDNFTAEDKPFEIGKSYIVKDGTDVALFATGLMVSKAIEAAKALEGEISVRVINVPTLKPIDGPCMIKNAEGCNAVVTAEEGSLVGGLGSVVSVFLAQQCKPIGFIGIHDQYGCSAHNYDELLEYYGLTVDKIIEKVREMNAL